MAYYFAVETTESTFEGLNIKKTQSYKETVKSEEETYECTLEEIDKFTTNFHNLSRLMHTIYSDGAITWSRYKYPLSVLYVDGLEVRKVKGNILLADSKKYIENPNLVLEYIINKIKEKDALFLRKLGLIQDENSIARYKISKLATALEEKIIYDEKTTIEKLKNPLQSKIEEKKIEEVALLLVYDCYINGEGELIFSGEIDYEKLHNTIAFISEYEKELEKNNQYTRIRKPQ